MNKTDILNYLQNHYQEFKDKYNVEQIGLFGSYARDEATKDSDIDIFVKMPPKAFDMLSLKESLEDTFAKEIDIVRIRDKMNPYLYKRIIKDGINAKIPMSRMGTGKEIAEATAFLLSDSSSYITGETLKVNGGMNMA